MRATYIKDFKTWADQFKFSVPLTVRFSDVDMYGIVNNAVTISYLEYARIEYLEHLELMENWLDLSGKTAPVVANMQCDYVKPIVYNEKLMIYVKVNHVGNSSVDIHYLGKNAENDVVFTARTTMVQVEKETGKGFPWTEKEKSLYLEN